MKTGAELIQEERQRQINEEKHSPERDDQYTQGELAYAACSYALGCTELFTINPQQLESNRYLNQLVEVANEYAKLWPWSMEHWKPTDAIRDLTKAGALIAAEIDRLQREKAKNG